MRMQIWREGSCTRLARTCILVISRHVGALEKSTPSSHLFGLGVLAILTQQSPLLGLLAFLSPLTGSLGLCTAGVHLFLEDSLALLLGLGLVDLHSISDQSIRMLQGIQAYMFDQCTLVLEGVTLAELIELVVKVFVDLAGGTIFDEQAAENS